LLAREGFKNIYKYTLTHEMKKKCVLVTNFRLCIHFR
jgi:hypothetical protein